mmetsp:Transcript_62029/g.108610  ORF Transcript_62029/g.108610 Transcript_62029/m.108610 type:complete len:212 (-) Transcript_62029:185-820(-)
MRHMLASVRARLSAMTPHCSMASSSSMPLTFSRGFNSLRSSPSFCLSVRCCASSCCTVTVCFVARTQMAFWARIGNSRMTRTSVRATTDSSSELISFMSDVFSFFTSTSASSAGRFRETAAGRMTRLSARKDFLSLLSKSTIQRSPCQLSTSPDCPLYCWALAKPTTATRLPGSSSAGFRLAGLRDMIAPVRRSMFNRSGLSGFTPRETQY